MSQALSQHAEDAYDELATDRRRAMAEKIFKALTDTSSDPRGVRRPASLQELCAVADADEAEVTAVIDRFRKPGRSVLMPPLNPDKPLTKDTVIDISHESLMRVWERLIGWAEEERLSAEQYARVARDAALHEKKKMGLWQDPQLQLALDWKEENKPTAAWAQRYDPAFEQTMRFLDESEKERTARIKAAMQRRRWTFGGIVFGLIVALALATWALIESRIADQRAEEARAFATLVAAEANPDPLLGTLLLGEMMDAPEPAGGLRAVRQVADTPFPRTVLNVPGGVVFSAAFNAAGDRIVTASSDGTARIWRASWPALLAFLREATTACLTDDQRIRYLGESPAAARAAYAACERAHGRPAPPDE